MASGERTGIDAGVVSVDVIATHARTVDTVTAEIRNAASMKAGGKVAVTASASGNAEAKSESAGKFEAFNLSGSYAYAGIGKNGDDRQTVKAGIAASGVEAEGDVTVFADNKASALLDENGHAVN